jgi:hypothetical protein
MPKAAGVYLFTSTQSSTHGAVAVALLLSSLASAQTTKQLPGFELERKDMNTGRGTLRLGNVDLMVPGA